MAISHSTDGDAITREMIRAAMQRLSNKRRRHTYVTKKEILKVLFKTKYLLPDSNPVKDHLAYYWYLEGPYSERIYDCLDDLVESGVVVRRKTTKSETYRLGSNHTIKPLVTSDDLDAARRTIDGVVNDFVNVNDMVREIYRYAPYSWYTTYNLKFRSRFRNYCNAVLEPRPPTYKIKNVRSWLEDIVVDYPTAPAFLGHRRVVMDFAKMLSAVIASDPHHKHGHLLHTLLTLCDKIWTVFAYGVRVEHHDEYYDGRLDDWRRMYEQEMDKLDVEVVKQVEVFDDIVQDNTRLAPEIEKILENPDMDNFTPLTPEVIRNTC